MIGKRFGWLVVIERLPESKLVCQCDCGNTRTVYSGHLNAGCLKSCGCHVTRHGHSGKIKSVEYVSYHNMIARCHNPKNKRYKDYGGKGIFVCDRWRESFLNFIDDMGACPVGHQIDRINNSHGYEPGNCRWVTPKENMANRSISKIWVLFGVEYKTAAEAGRAHGVSGATIIAWCAGRMAEGRRYPPKDRCSFWCPALITEEEIDFRFEQAKAASREILRRKGLIPVPA